MNSIEELIKEVALKNGVALSRDDPILILQTINERLMDDTAKAQQKILQQFKEELEGVAHRWSGEAKDKAEKTLTAALRISKEVMAVSMQEGSAAAAAALRADLESTLRRTADSAADIRRMLWISLSASMLALVASALVLWASLAR